MSDYTNREIPILDDIISSPVKTDALLADAKINNEPEIQANVQLDSQLDSLDEPVLISEANHTHTYNELNDTHHKLLNTQEESSEHSETRIEPTLHHSDAAETFEPPAESETDNTDNFALSDTVEDASLVHQQTPDEEHDDSDILSSGERLYRYVPETTVDVEEQNSIAHNHADAPAGDALKPESSDTVQLEHQATDNEQFEASQTQNSDKTITDTGHGDEHHFICNESVFKTNSEATDSKLSNDCDNDAKHDKNEQTNYSSDALPKDNGMATFASTPQTDITEHESALIDYQTDVDPYALDEAEIDDSTQTTDKVSDDAPQWHDIQQDINNIQAETNATDTLPALHNLDTDALTEQILQNILPNIEQQLRLHVKAAIQDALNPSTEKISASENSEEHPIQAESNTTQELLRD